MQECCAEEFRRLRRKVMEIAQGVVAGGFVEQRETLGNIVNID